jgi:hypothetical protein
VRAFVKIKGCIYRKKISFSPGVGGEKEGKEKEGNVKEKGRRRKIRGK